MNMIIFDLTYLIILNILNTVISVMFVVNYVVKKCRYIVLFFNHDIHITYYQ